MRATAIIPRTSAQLESRKLVYVTAVALNRQVSYQLPEDEKPRKRSLAEIAQALSVAAFTAVSLHLDKPRTVWVAVLQVQVAKLEGPRWVAIQLNASTCLAATDIDYFLTNAPEKQVSAEWIASTYSQRNWVEVFYRDAKGWFGLSGAGDAPPRREYQVRDAKSMKRHWILVFTAYTFILWHQLTGGVRRRWATKPLQTISETLEAFRTAVEFRLVRWLNAHVDVFAAHRAKSGYVWA